MTVRVMTRAKAALWLVRARLESWSVLEKNTEVKWIRNVGRALG